MDLYCQITGIETERAGYLGTPQSSPGIVLCLGSNDPLGQRSKAWPSFKRLGVSVANGSAGQTGTVSPIYEPAMRLKRAGVVPGHDLTSEAALAKLSYLLALPDLTIEDITRQMSQSLRGELTEQIQTAFVHPKSQLSASLTELAALGYAVARGQMGEVQSCLRGNVEWMLNEGDYSGNTPLVSSLVSAL